MDNAKLKEIAESLVGTCGTLEEALAAEDIDIEDLTTEDHVIIDEITYNCDDCGWWFDIDDQSDAEQVCNSCYEEREDLGEEEEY